jgi:Cu(I)/Ag(I) efflux system membrane fusion protein/cobalt-zinc-cadmium efflux system membrane fusion protein
MKKNHWIGIVFILVLIGGGSTLLVHSHLHRHQAAGQKQLYTCPMHPQIVKDRPGDCPICGMKLVPLKRDEPEKDKSAGHKPKTMYRSSMKPDEISDRPGKDSMGMEMIPFETDEERVETTAGLAPVTISKEKRELIGMNFGSVKMMRLAKETRTSARIVPDETRLFKIAIKAEGWVEKLYVNQTGQYVRKGDPLLDIYSPELVSVQQEYVSSVAALKKLESAPGSTATSDSADPGDPEGLESAVREKLRLYDISDARIDRLRSSEKVERTMTIESPVSGYVLEKMVLQGQRIVTEDPLMTIADLSSVWGEADIYETDLPYVKAGTRAELTLSFWPGKTFKGRISFVSPFLESETRTAKARMEISNPGLVLKPGMYADVTLSYDFGERLVVPESAVMRTGVRDYAFVDGGQDVVIPREVKLGAYSEVGFYEVISGLNAGDRVVISANFLIDSESSLKSALKSAAGAGAQKQ